MNEELTVPVEGQIIERGDSLQCSAFTPAEMLHANEALIGWCDTKIASLSSEEKELREAYTHAKERKWKSGTLKKHADLALKRIEFFGKMKTGLEAGYYIVPNFPIEVFAIRTNKERPDYNMTVERYRPYRKETAQLLPYGEGEYQNPFPMIEDRFECKDDKGNDLYRFWADKWKEMEFPLSMSKPQIMQATSRAMALKIFEEIGILEQKKSGDPLIVGRLIDPRPGTHKLFPRHLTFIIAWHLDTKLL